MLTVLSATRCAAVSCPVAAVHAPSDADTAFLNHDYDKAARLYQDQLTARPNDPELIAGLSRVLLRQQKVREAQELTQKALAQNPESVVLMTALGDVTYRNGTPWLAAAIAQRAIQKDPCYPPLRLLNAQLLRISSMYASAATEVAMAHRLDPHDPTIRLMWLNGLAAPDRITELESYLSSKTGDDPQDLASLHLYLDHLKTETGQPQKSCHLVSPAQITTIPFITLRQDANRIRGFGLDVKLNDQNARLQIDTGAGGLVISRSVAQRAGLKKLAQSTASGIGSGGDQAAYTAYADDIRIGALEFKDCEVQVIDARSVVDTDGLIGMDVFSRFLVTLDYPLRKLTLGPLPQRPDETTPATPTLETANSGQGAAADAAAATSKSQASGPAASHGPRDRFVAPEMKDWSRVYRVGHMLLTQTSLNNKEVKLFVLDTGAFTTTIAPDVARLVTHITSADGEMEVRGVSGAVQKVYFADDIEFKFGHIIQQAHNIVAFQSPQISRNVGMEVAGFIGITTLGQLTVNIDYRDGLVKFDYDANRGYKYPGAN